MKGASGVEVPDVLGLTLEEARADLATHGRSVRVEETKPPRATGGSGAARVVRQRNDEGEVVLTVTHERYTVEDDRARRGRPSSR